MNKREKKIAMAKCTIEYAGNMTKMLKDPDTTPLAKALLWEVGWKTWLYEMLHIAGQIDTSKYPSGGEMLVAPRGPERVLMPCELPDE